MRPLIAWMLVALVACSSSGSDPIDPVAEEYCTVAGCSDLNNCERLITDTIEVFCTDETSAYYECVATNDCDVTACEAEWEERTVCTGQAASDAVRERIANLAPAANLGHRGTGPTAPGNPYPENSIPAFLAAINEGADGVELDARLTSDGQVIVMHDDTLDRTTDCTGCVSAMTFDEVRACRLLDGDGNPTDESPPDLLEVYAAVFGNSLVNIEMKVSVDSCATPETGAEPLVRKVLEEVIALNVAGRTLFSSFDEEVVELVKTIRSGFYSALVSDDPGEALIERALELQQDAIHPSTSITEATVQAALEAGLQVNVFGANTAEEMQAQIDKGVTGIITDEPGILADLIATEP